MTFVLTLPDQHKLHTQHDEKQDVLLINALENMDECTSRSTCSTLSVEKQISGVENHKAPYIDGHTSFRGEKDSEPPINVQQVQQITESPIAPTDSPAARDPAPCAAGAASITCRECDTSIQSDNPLSDHNWINATTPDGRSEWLCRSCMERDTDRIVSITIERQKQVDWFINVAGIKAFDLASRLADTSMFSRHKVTASKINDYLGWMAFNNTHHNREAQIRPYRTDAVPLIFFDDVLRKDALKIAGKYSACVVETSAEGGCHVWIHTDRDLTEHERYLVQKHLHGRIGADAGSVSGEHYGRLCGFKNWKRGGCWLNLLAATKRKPLVITPDMLVDVSPVSPMNASLPSQRGSAPAETSNSSRDTSASGQDWGWACERLSKGDAPDQVESELADKAAARHKPKPEAYAQRTVERAMTKLGMR